MLPWPDRYSAGSCISVFAQPHVTTVQTASPTCAQLAHRAQAGCQLPKDGCHDAKGCEAAGKQLILWGEAPVGDTKELLGPVQQGDLGILQGTNNLCAAAAAAVALEGTGVGQQAGNKVEADKACQEEPNLGLQEAAGEWWGKRRQAGGHKTGGEHQRGTASLAWPDVLPELLHTHLHSCCPTAPPPHLLQANLVGQLCQDAVTCDVFTNHGAAKAQHGHAADKDLVLRRPAQLKARKGRLALLLGDTLALGNLWWGAAMAGQSVL